MLEGGIRVPAIISYPRMLPENEIRHQWANSIDWMPTLTEIAGVALPHNNRIDGKSLLPLLMDARISSPHETMFWGTGMPENENHPWAVRKGPWKLLGNPSDPTGKLHFDEKDKLYLVNLESDSTEVNNLAAMHPEKTAELHSLYKDWIETVKNK
ncbi:sulfatase/phosphatase domain-containing protein [Cyclobacterium xiamenense]|uniref:sulfatase/phosphatase domain-containing protein n=1 Tax=Cyclobacterium xiamenense TaxID=1297121 RepID=UPI0035D1022F